jgi:hypothetical protein
MHLWLVIALAFTASTVYAFLLSTPLGVRLTLAKTHYTVIFGVAMTIGFVALVDPSAAQLLLLFFAATGIPIVVRSEIRDLAERQALEKRMRDGE